MKNFSKLHQYCLLTLVLSNAAFAGDLKDRFKDRRDTRPLMETAQGNFGAIEAGGGTIMAVAGVMGGHLSPKFRATLSASQRGAIRNWWLLAVVMGADGAARVYLVNEGKNPSLTPLPGLVAHAVTEGPRKTWKIATKTGEIVSDGIDDALDYVYDKNGLLKDVKKASRVTADAVKEVVDSVRSPAVESSEH